MKVAYKVWLDQNGKAFGEGPYNLLRGIDQTGSLRKASLQMDMSYNQAWNLVRAIEGRLGFALITRRAGGVSGGGSELTPEGRRLMNAYALFRDEVRESLEQVFNKYFGEFSGSR